MTKNPILDELHAVREQLLEDAGGTLDALVDRLQAEEQQSDRPRFKSRRTKRCTGAAKSGEGEVENLSSPPGDLSQFVIRIKSCFNYTWTFPSFTTTSASFPGLRNVVGNLSRLATAIQ